MRSAILLLLFRGLLVSSLAGAQSAQPPPKPSVIATHAMNAPSRARVERFSRPTPYSSETVDRKKYRSAIVQDASRAAGFAGFYSAPFFPSITAGANALLSGDFNNDGKPDLVSVNPSDVATTNNVAVLLNDGTRRSTIRSSARSAWRSENSQPMGSFYAVDLNGDGYTDLVIPGYEDSLTGIFQVAVLLNHKDGTFPTITYLPLQNLSPPYTTFPTGTVALGKTTASGGIDLVSVQSFTTAGAQQPSW